MAGWLEDVLSALRGGSPTRRLAARLGERLGAAPAHSGTSTRLAGKLGKHPCRLELHVEQDRMTATVRVTAGSRGWSMEWIAPSAAADGRQHLSEHVVVPAEDAAWLERLPLAVRLHAIEVVEAGRGSLRYQPGSLRLDVRAAGLDRPNAADQAEIRLDVMEQIAAALPRLESGR